MKPGAKDAKIDDLKVSAYSVPTDFPEADGTYAWDKTTLVLVEVKGGGKTGLGYTYANTATAQLIQEPLAGCVKGKSAMDLEASWGALQYKVRNMGHPGICQMGISAIDIALWDLKAKILDLPLVALLGGTHERVPIYGSGGFTTYSKKQLHDQLGGWVEQGIPRVKMKIGTDPGQDLDRVRSVREAIGDKPALFVDANGAYTRKEALAFAERFHDLGVVWFEEPVSSDDLEGLRLLRDRGPAAMDIAAGEYGYMLWYFRRMLEAGAVDCLQADITRCGGVTGIRKVAALCEARCLQLSGHCAPSLHVHPLAAATPTRHLEYFHDHVRIERMLFDGAPLTPKDGALVPDLSRPGLGLEFKHADAKKFLVWQG